MARVTLRAFAVRLQTLSCTAVASRLAMARTIFSLCAALSLSSCASTQELYAEYDSTTCLVQLSQHQTGVFDTHVLWEPAIYFGYDEDTLTAEQMAKLDISFKVLERFPELTVGLQGFTDKRGNNIYNYYLASRRVKAVAAYLKKKGLFDIRIVPMPAGEIAGHLGLDKAAGLARNRRVELVLMDHSGAPLPLELAFSETITPTLKGIKALKTKAARE